VNGGAALDRITGVVCVRAGADHIPANTTAPKTAAAIKLKAPPRKNMVLVAMAFTSADLPARQADRRMRQKRGSSCGRYKKTAQNSCAVLVGLRVGLKPSVRGSV
jgi:Pyruvate/2-oxoacid:ferredoxin oxidoreductase gamma subunit